MYRLDLFLKVMVVPAAFVLFRPGQAVASLREIPSLEDMLSESGLALFLMGLPSLMVFLLAARVLKLFRPRVHFLAHALVVAGLFLLVPAGMNWRTDLEASALQAADFDLDG